jgi:3-hydroxyacyl-[acyl-carrier-protein] dehydratase
MGFKPANTRCGGVRYTGRRLSPRPEVRASIAPAAARVGTGVPRSKLGGGVRFVLVDKITDIEPGKRAAGYRDLSPDAEHYRDHMPAYAVEPGVLILESMAQLGGRLVQQSVKQASARDVLPMLAMVNQAEFRRPVRPPCRLHLSAEILSLRATGARVSAHAEVDDQRVAAATLTYVLVGLDHDAVGIGLENLAVIREWGQETWEQMTSGQPGAAASGQAGQRPVE